MRLCSGPNAIVAYSDRALDGAKSPKAGGGPTTTPPDDPDELRPPATARIVALRGISKGEEVVHPYVERSEPMRLRHEGLAIYGIRCRCTKCELEGARA